MKKLILCVMLLLTGCSAIDANLMVQQGTPISVECITTDVMTPLDANNTAMIGKRMVLYTSEKLMERNITIQNESDFKVIYELRTIKSGSQFRIIGNFGSGGNAYEIRYIVSLQQNGKTIFRDSDEKDGDDLGEIMQAISKRTARIVSSYYK